MATYTAEELNLLVRTRLGFGPGCVVDFAGATVTGLRTTDSPKPDARLVTVAENAGVRRFVAGESWVFVSASTVLELPLAATCPSGSECLIKLAPTPGLRAVVRPAPGDFLEGDRIPICLTAPGELLNLRTEGASNWLVIGHSVPPFARVWTFALTARVRSALARFTTYCADNGWAVSGIACDTQRMVYCASVTGRAGTQTEAQQTLGALLVVLASIDPDFSLTDVSYSAEDPV